MRYMFLVYSKESENRVPESLDQVAAGHRAVLDEAGKRGVLEGASPLKPTSMATTVRPDGDNTLVIDGPFAETKEQLAGYYIIDCQNLDEAIEWAKKIPSGCKGAEGCIEIRPMQEIYGLRVTPKREQWIQEPV